MRDWGEFVRSRLLLPELSPERETRVVRELAAQLEDFYREALARGLNESEADAFARRQIRDWRGLASEVRSADQPNVKPFLERLEDRAVVAAQRRGRGWNMPGDLLHDLRYGLRQLAAHPGFAAVAVLTLALGIGANSTIFSILYAVALQPLPYLDASHLVFVGGSAVKPDNVHDWRDSVRSFNSFVPYASEGVELTSVAEPASLRVMLVPSGYFSSLGIPLLLGRGFLPEEDRPGGPPVVILGDHIWRRQFAADPGILGRTAMIDKSPHTVVGVVSAELASTWQTPYDLWRPYHARQPRYTYALAHLRSGVTLAAARAELDSIATRFPLSEEERRSNPPVVVTPLTRMMVGEFRAALFVLAGAAAFVLLTACANLAHLLLYRAATRGREFAIRIALGAGRTRLFRQVFAESLLLAGLGAGVGLLLAVWGSSLLVALVPYSVNRLHQASVGWPVFVFTAVVAILGAFLFGWFPARAAARLNPLEGLKEGGDWGVKGRSWGRLMNSFVVGQIAVALTLVIGAGLLLKTFLILRPSDPGFAVENRLTFRVLLPEPRYPQPAQRVAFLNTVLAHLRAQPGVRGAAVVSFLPFTGMTSLTQLHIDGRPPLEQMTHVRVATPHYHSIMQIPVLQGRGLLSTDDERAPSVAVVNETLARQLWPGETAVGKQVSFSRRSSSGSGVEQVEVTIVGVLRDNRMRGSLTVARGELTLPFPQLPQRYLSFVVHTAGDPHAAVEAARAAVRTGDPDLPLQDVQSMEEMLYTSVSEQRFNGFLVAAFAALGLGLALLGTYGVLAQSVQRRTQEMGIRMALGADPSSILRLVLRKGLGLALMGIAIGLAGSLALTRFLKSLLYEVSPTDPATFVVISALVLFASGVACYIPARRATRVDPLDALRYE